MKQSLVILFSAFLLSCGGEGEKATNGDEKKDETTGSTLPKGITQADYDKGLSLVASSDCLTCHQIKEKLTGPSYAEIAEKYEPTKENITLLAGKIINGGSGVWGTVPMTPHDGLSQEDAEAMVKYVLSLKNAQ
ncbi:MAG TPA: c-type cytochrome [Chitinophagaceae bacterium]|nr:c-type cytochrome [Chitinophagaceae bacterium]